MEAFAHLSNGLYAILSPTWQFHPIYVFFISLPGLRTGEVGKCRT